MLKESCNYQGDTLVDIDEPIAVCGTIDAKKSTSDRWNPNVPFVGTQEEWWEHFHEIEKGKFTPLKEANKEFEAWKKEYLAKR